MGPVSGSYSDRDGRAGINWGFTMMMMMIYKTITETSCWQAKTGDAPDPPHITTASQKRSHTGKRVVGLANMFSDPEP